MNNASLSQQPPQEPVDILILGGGPTGLFAAFYAGLRGASCTILDSMPLLGGRLTAVYPDKFIYDVAGFPKISAQALVDALVEQVRPYNPGLALGLAAETLTRDGASGLWHVGTTSGTVYAARTVIIAAGVGSYTPKRHLAPGAKEFENRGIAYSVTNKNIYRNKKVVVLGGGDSALDWANEMTAVATEVHLVHRSSAFRAHHDSITKLQSSGAHIHLNTEVAAFLGNDAQGLTSVTLRSLEDDSITTQVSCDTALVMFGFNSSLGKIKEWGLDLHGECILVNEKMETSLPGIYAAGDIAHHPGKLKLIATGFAEAAIAANFAKSFVDPKAKVQPIHSTTLMELKEKKAAQ